MTMIKCLFCASELKKYVISHSYPNVTLSRVELYASDPYDRVKEALKVTIKDY